MGIVGLLSPCEFGLFSPDLLLVFAQRDKVRITIRGVGLLGIKSNEVRLVGLGSGGHSQFEQDQTGYPR
jgi:hypothetical protein